MNAFLNFAESHGLVINNFVFDGKIHRCGTHDKPKSKNGSFCFDGKFGWVQNFSTMTEVAFFNNGKLTEEEKREYGLMMKQRRYEAIKAQREAISRAKAYFEALPAISDAHPYLTNKGLTIRGCRGLRIDGDMIVIPVFDMGHQLCSYQTIKPNGEKKFAYGCPTAGGYFAIGRKRPSITILCEGFATGLAIFQAVTESIVVVCFNAANLVKVAQQLTNKIKTPRTIVCADNDYETEKRIGTNPGVEKGKEAAQILNCGLAFPVGIKGTDWADALIEWRSAFRVKNEIMKGASRTV